MTDTPAQDLRSALEPCPFCGGEAFDVPDNQTEWAIQCRDCNASLFADGERPQAEAIAAWNRRAALAQPAEPQHQHWAEVDAHRDLSRIIPDMEGKIADAKTRYAHCLPNNIFGPLESSITELRVLRHEVAQPAENAKGGEVAAQIDMDAAERLEATEWPGNHAAWTYIIAEHFAQHRTASYAHPPAAGPVGLRELREKAAQVADGQVMSGNDQWSAGHDAAARKIAHAIRSLPLS